MPRGIGGFERTFSRFQAIQVSMMLEVEHDCWHAILRCKPRQINIQGVGELRYFFLNPYVIKLLIELIFRVKPTKDLKTHI